MTSSDLDKDLCSDLKKNILAITNSGLKTIEPSALKTIKSICRKSNNYVIKTYEILKYQLKKNHSEIRYSCFQICIELFKRSHVFRELFINDLREIFELTTGTSTHNELPLPKPRAVELKRLALETYHALNQEYGKTYQKLSVGYNFLKNCKNVDFEALETQNNAEREQRVAEERRLQVVNEEKVKKVDQEIKDNLHDIRNSITILKNCTALLIPTLETFFISNDNDKDVETTNSVLNNTVDLKCHGISRTFEININVNPEESVNVTRNSENEVVIENAEEILRLINTHHLPLIKKWIKLMTKIDHKGIKEIINLKEELEVCKRKYLKLNITVDETGGSSDEDLEEVEEKEGYESTVIEPSTSEDCTASCSSMRQTDKEWNLSLGKTEDPTMSLPTIFGCFKKRESQSRNYFEKAASDRKEKLLALAPKLPFDIDLYHWEDKNVKAPIRFEVKMENHSFWSASKVDEMEDVRVPEGEAALRTRVIEFSGNFEPVKWACRAPLPNGTLCQRKDRIKCPFHGKIVARDEHGRTVDGSNEGQNRINTEMKPVPDWQDPQLLADIKASTGIDLTAPVRGRGRQNLKSKSNKLPGLTNIKSLKNTPYTRLSKKIFKKSTMKRVAASMDRIERKKFRDKFGDQFNYVHETS